MNERVIAAYLVEIKNKTQVLSEDISRLEHHIQELKGSKSISSPAGEKQPLSTNRMRNAKQVLVAVLALGVEAIAFWFFK